MPFPLADAIFWVAVACCAISQLAIIRSAVVSPTRVAGAEPSSSARRASEIAWAVIPGVALVVVLCLTYRAMHPIYHVVVADVPPGGLS